MVLMKSFLSLVRLLLLLLDFYDLICQPFQSYQHKANNPALKHFPYSVPHHKQQSHSEAACWSVPRSALQRLGLLLYCGSFVHRHESPWLHACHISFVRDSVKSLKADSAHWINMAGLSREYIRENLGVCAHLWWVYVRIREGCGLGILVVYTELI